MSRTRWSWIVFGLFLLVGIVAMGWMSLTTLRLDQAEIHAKKQAASEEKLRLALWRMDSALTPLIAQESARPYFQYSPFYPAKRAYALMLLDNMQSGEVLVPSPLLTLDTPDILLHFQFGPDGELTSPQVPSADMRDLAEVSRISPEKLQARESRLEEFGSSVTRAALLQSLHDQDALTIEPISPERLADALETNKVVKQQKLLNVGEWNVRAEQQLHVRGGRAGETIVMVDGVPVRSGKSLPAFGEGAMNPVWIGDALVLARRVSINGLDYVQGCWLNWTALRDHLVASVKDLLPKVDLEPASSEGEARHERMLAALPVRLIPGAPPPSRSTGVISPIRISLFIAWAGTFLAALAVGIVLHKAVTLSERRGAFVSAVTHELRTPLTTFRLYTEMLANGMVPDQTKRAEYLVTLQSEADRLGHLVENVLAYARLEKGRTPRTLQSLALGDLVDRATDRLVRHAEQCGMTLTVEIPEDLRSIRVRTDTSAVEQIMFNLVDNACKYARDASDSRIHVEAAPQGEYMALRVRDHGHGVLQQDKRRLFEPFHKSARDAASSAPGVGLGLALSRRLARNIGGDLRLDTAFSHGACFILTMPIARRAII